MEGSFAIYRSDIGYIHIEHIDRRLTLLHILRCEPIDFGTQEPFTDMVFAQVSEYLSGERVRFDVDIDISRCTPFQQLVLKELLKIPYGEVRRYADIATAIGNPKASRAVGSANNRNPIHIIIPCHRVIGANGSLTGYAAGIDVKSKLLELELANKPH